MGKSGKKNRSRNRRVNIFLQDQYFSGSPEGYDIRMVGKWVLVKQRGVSGDYNVAIWDMLEYSAAQRKLKGIKGHGNHKF